MHHKGLNPSLSKMESVFWIWTGPKSGGLILALGHIMAFMGHLKSGPLGPGQPGCHGHYRSGPLGLDNFKLPFRPKLSRWPSHTAWKDTLKGVDQITVRCIIRTTFWRKEIRFFVGIGGFCDIFWLWFLESRTKWQNFRSVSSKLGAQLEQREF